MNEMELLEKMEEKLKNAESIVIKKGELSPPEFFEFRAATNFIRNGITIMKHNTKGEKLC